MSKASTKFEYFGHLEGKLIKHKIKLFQKNLFLSIVVIKREISQERRLLKNIYLFLFPQKNKKKQKFLYFLSFIFII